MDELLKNRTFAIHAVSAAGAVSLGTALVYPLDTLKVLIQVGSSPERPLSTEAVLNRVRAMAGNSGLYNGIGWFMFGRTLGLGARFVTYEILTAFCKDGREDDYVYVSEALMSGFAAGAVESLVTSPFEFLKLRVQVASASHAQHASNKTAVSHVTTSSILPRYSPDMKVMGNSVGLLSTLPSRHVNMVDALKGYPWMMTGSGKPPPVTNVRIPSDVVSLEGWGALWRNVRSGIARDSIYGGVFFSTWQFLHIAMLNWKAVGMDPMPRSDDEAGPLSPIAVSLAAGFSGSFAAAASHGFDTARSRSQCTVLPKYVTMERKCLKWNRPGKRFERLTGIHPSDRKLLLNGIGLRMARCGIGSFATVGAYFLAVNLLAPK